MTEQPTLVEIAKCDLPIRHYIMGVEADLAAARAEAQQLREERDVQQRRADAFAAELNRLQPNMQGRIKALATGTWEAKAVAAEAEVARLRSELTAVEQARDKAVAWSDAAAKASEMFLEELDTLKAQHAQAVAALERPDKTLHRYVKGTHSSDCGACRVLALLRGTEEK